MPPLKTRPPKDPLRNFTFSVEIAGISRGSFSKVSIAEQTSDVIDYRTGDQQPHFQKIPGLTKQANVTLEWGLDDERDLIAWRQQVVDGEPAENVRKDVFIVALNTNGDEVARMHVINAWPVNFKPADFNAKGNDVALVTLTLAHEGIEFV
jgi:phage tail-like protein